MIELVYNGSVQQAYKGGILMIRKIQTLKARKGFTLVELMVVIAIIGVLAAILIPLMNNFLQSARISNVNATAANAKNYMTYWLQNEMKNNRGMNAVGVTIIEFQIDGDKEWTASFAGGENNGFDNFTASGQTHHHISEKTNEETAATPTGGASMMEALEDYFEGLFPDAIAATFVISMEDNAAVAAIFSNTGDVANITHHIHQGTGNIHWVANGRSTNLANQRNIVGTAPVADQPAALT
jgi:type IV pilus assembly protein PilA